MIPELFCWLFGGHVPGEICSRCGRIDFDAMELRFNKNIGAAIARALLRHQLELHTDSGPVVEHHARCYTVPLEPSLPGEEWSKK